MSRREDVLNLYNFLLGRDPENDTAIMPRLNRKMSEVFSEIVRSEEFSFRLVRPAIDGVATSQYQGSVPLFDLVAWANKELPLDVRTRELLDEANSWDDVSRALLRDTAVIRLNPELQRPAVRRSVERNILAAEGGVSIEKFFVSPDGQCFLSGSLTSLQAADIRNISINRAGALIGTTGKIGRCLRVKKGELPDPHRGLAGFWAIFSLKEPVEAGVKLEVVLAADKERCCPVVTVVVSDMRLRDLSLEHLADARFYGEPTAEAFFQLDGGVGQSFIDYNYKVVARILDGAYRMRFGTRRVSYDGTIIVCLYGKPDYLMLQAALFSECPGYDGYEFIYVSNSPELCERLASDAAIASRIYGLAITLIMLPGNAGFGAANNAAAAVAETDRLLFVNPDVLPRDAEWPRRHAELVRDLPPRQIKFFGATLYYDDGSLMHGGMYFDVDYGFTIRSGNLLRRDAMRVEHYGKGAPSELMSYHRARQVPAVTGAFMSVDRRWFEKLGGFSRKYIFGHYEDADLCLRSLESGTPTWIHDLPFWHLESKGSAQTPAIIGGRLVNRWFFTSTWHEFVKKEFGERHPKNERNSSSRDRSKLSSV